MCLEELRVADVFGLRMGSDPVGVVLPSFFIMIHMDSVTQNIQLVYILLEHYFHLFPNTRVFYKHQSSYNILQATCQNCILYNSNTLSLLGTTKHLSVQLNRVMERLITSKARVYNKNSLFSGLCIS